MSIFNKSVDKIYIDDIQDLIDTKERENITLDYKAEMQGGDRDKKELAKDVSAFANSEGGYLIIGVKEIDGVPDVLCGTEKNIGRQKIEEWIENVLVANISQKISVSIKVIPIQKDDDKVAVVIYIPLSSRKPHMVIYQNENRYYKRHLFQVLAASESEVREMFRSSTQYLEEVSTFLNGRNLTDDKSPMFGKNKLTDSLTNYFASEHKGLGITQPKRPFVIYAICPKWLDEKVNIASGEFEDWLNSKSKGYYPNEHFDLIPHEKQISLNSILGTSWCSGEGKKDWLWYYFEIFRNGYIEAGVSSELFWHMKAPAQPLMQLTRLIGLLFVSLGFAKEFYSYIKYYDELIVLMCLVDIDGLMPHGFGKKDEKQKWLQPYDFTYCWKKPICLEKNIRLEKTILVSDLTDETIKETVHHFALRISNACGEKIAKCFDDSGKFNVEGFKEFDRRL